MKPTIIVEGKVYPVREMVFNENGIESVSILKDDSYLRVYDAKVETVYFVEQPLKLNFDEVLNLNSELEDKLIKHLESVYKEESKVLEEIAYTTAEDSLESLRLFNKVSPEQSCRNAIKYLEQQQKMFGMCDAIESVKAFLEGYYDKGGEK